MHALRAIPAAALLYATIWHMPAIFSVIQLDQVMTPEEQKQTGVSNLTPAQKQQLEEWINSKFVPKPKESPPKVIPHLAENLQGGSILKMSDGREFHISPADTNKTQFWITPVELKIEESDDPNYPVKITNPLTGTSVKAREVSH